MENESLAREELKTRSIRATAGTFDALKRIAEEAHFDNQGSALAALISLWEEQNAKQLLPEQGQVIDDVRSHLQALSNIFLSQLDSMANTANRVRLDYQARMDAQDRTIGNLHRQLEEAREAAASKEELAKSLEELQDACQQLKAQAEQDSQEKLSLAATIRTLTEMNASQKAELAGLGEQIARAGELEQQLKAQAKSLAAKEEEIARLQEQHAHALEKAGIEKERAVLEERARAQAEIRALQAEFIKRFDNSDN